MIRTDRPCVRGLRTGGGTCLKDSVYDLYVYIASAYTQSDTLCLPVWAPAVGGKALSWSWVDIQEQNAGRPAVHRRGEVVQRSISDAGPLSVTMFLLVLKESPSWCGLLGRVLAEHAQSQGFHPHIN